MELRVSSMGDEVVEKRQRLEIAELRRDLATSLSLLLAPCLSGVV